MLMKTALPALVALGVALLPATASAATAQPTVNPVQVSPRTFAAFQNHNGGLCLDAETDAGGNPHNNGDKVQVWACIGTSQQQWQINQNGTITNENGGKCLDAETDAGGDPHNNGDKVQVWDCIGTLQQHWTFWSNGTITNNNGGKCLDAQTDATHNPGANGDRVQLWTCVGTLQQVWF